MFSSTDKRPPALVLRLEFEGGPSVVLEAASYEDELRLRAWLRRAMAVRALVAVVEDALDALEQTA